MNGTLATSGSLASSERKRRHGRDAVDHALVHADVDDVGAVLDLLAGDGDGLLVLALLDELGELRRAGDVRALADHHEDARLLRERLRARQAQRPRRDRLALRWAPVAREVAARRRLSASARAMAAMCSGVLPQQPPAMLMSPPSANSPR